MDPLYLCCFSRDRWKCRHCNDRNGLHPHHVTYRSQMGLDELKNLITLCHQCHRAHHDGKLDIIVLDRTDEDVIVSFQRKKGWKPV